MKYEKPEMVIVILDSEEVVTSSNTLENWGSGSDEDLDLQL